MLPMRSQSIARFVSKSFRNVSQASCSVPLTDPIESGVSSRYPRPSSQEVKISKLENGIRVASIDNGGSVSKLAISLQSGSRYESVTNQGISQLVKNAAFMANKDRSALRTVREMQDIGGSLECSTSREAITRQASFLRNKLVNAMQIMASAFNGPLFYNWELSEVKKMCRMENATYAANENAVNLELLHKAAFRNGIGCSLYCNDLLIGKFSAHQLENFAQNNYNGEQLVIVGVDVNHDDLMTYARELFGSLPQSQPIKTAPQKYYGGEAQTFTGVGLTYASLVAEGAGLFHKDLPTLLVLQKVLGSGPYIKWGSNTVSSRLNKAALAVSDTPFIINALNLSYSDCGLFGFNVIASPSSIHKVLKSGVAQVSNIAKGNISAVDLERAKNQAKASIMMVAENKNDLLDDIVTQVMYSNSYISPKVASAKIDAVTIDNLIQVSKKVFSGKPTLAVTGNTSNPPYLDELFS
uniref:Cytochrome b-c1 complex subunit 2,mitochondrial n=1 Tax=Hydra vulgaris TaxID=6087 RepID=T2MH24_HYDVU